MTAAQQHAASRVLVVDDDPLTRDALGLFFSSEGHECQVAPDAVTALQVVDRVSFDAVICDVCMEGMSGIELLERVRRTHPSVPVVVMTGMGGVQGAVDAIKRGAFQYVTKPCDFDELRVVVEGAIEEHRRRADSDRAPPSFPPVPTPRSTFAPELIGCGTAITSLRATIAAVAQSSAPVVLMGETGAGKELVARAIHDGGARRANPFVAVNAAAIPSDLVEAEVFGHVRGAFSGAIRSRRGLLTEADGGTLLLDEIGEMPAGLQAKLLRVLQFGEVRPVGSDRAHQVDVRVIAATHRDLPSLVREGRFREDLYFRLNVLPVLVPPLREHREDIPMLAAHFLEEARNRAPHSPVRSIGAEALQALVEAPWPGNVRELATIIERAVVFGLEETLNVDALATLPPSLPAARALPWSFPPGAPWTLRQLNRVYTDWVLARTSGNKEQAAAILGVDLSTLYRWKRSKQD